MIPILSIILLLAIYEGDSRGCDLIYEEYCYRAFEVSDGINWLDAQSSCAVWGGDLTSIATERENNLLYTAISDAVSNCWIGLYERDGMYQWVDGTVLNYTNLTASAPTDGNTNNCVQMNADGAYLWVVTDCDGTSNSFICKKPKNNDTTGYVFGELIDEGLHFRPLLGDIFLYNSTTLACKGEAISGAIIWLFSVNSDLSSREVLNATYLSTQTGVTWLLVNKTKQGYYQCQINGTNRYTVGVYNIARGTTVASEGTSYQYIVGIDRADVLLLCDPMNSGYDLSSLSWSVTNGDTFSNPLNILSSSDSLPEFSIEIKCFSNSSPILLSYIRVYVPAITVTYKPSITIIYNIIYPGINTLPIEIGSKYFTISGSIAGRWKLPDGTYQSSATVSYIFLLDEYFGLYQFYANNWNDEEVCVIQINIVIKVTGQEQEIIFNDSTYALFTREAYTLGTISWIDAQTSCVAWGGNLTTIYSKQVDSLLNILLTRFYQHKCWIGLNDITTEAGTNGSAFVWVDGSTSTYRQFGTTGWLRPGNNDSTYDCVVIRYYYQYVNGWSDGWADRGCKHFSYCYFCQRLGDSRGCDLIYEEYCYRAFEVSDGINWLDAQSSCAVWGGDLTSITTERENNLLYTAISDAVSNCWIGLYERDGMYQWVDGTVLNYTNLTASAPTDGNTNNCVQMYTDGAYLWVDTDCDGTSNSFICKKPKNNDTTGYVFGELIDEGLHFRPLLGDIFLYNSTTLACEGEVNSGAIIWLYSVNSDLSSSEVLNATYLSTQTGVTWLLVNKTKQGYYQCQINGTNRYTVGVYNIARGTTVASEGTSYQYIVGIDRADVLLLCDPMNSSYDLSSLSWSVTNGDTFSNPLNILSSSDSLPEFSTKIKCFSNSSPILLSYIRVYVPTITVTYKPSITIIYNIIYPGINTLPIEIGSKYFTISGSIAGRWKLPDGTYQSSATVSYIFLLDEYFGLYQLYANNWNDEEVCVIQINIVIKVTGQEQEIIFNDSTYALFTREAYTLGTISWIDAQTSCVAWGGNLTTIYSKQVDSLLNILLTRFYQHTCWIGLNDITTEAGTNGSAFVWVDGSTSTYRQFGTTGWLRPGNNDSTYDCVAIRYYANEWSDGWYDRRCNDYSYCYFCQRLGDSRGCDLIYEGSCYRAFEVSDGINWLDAQSSCAVWGGDLTSITTERENNLLYTAISDAVSNCWIGLYERDGMYQWIDGTVLNYTNWAENVTYTTTTTYGCVVINLNGSWTNTDCDTKRNVFICKLNSTNSFPGYSTINFISLSNSVTIQNGSTIVITDDSAMINCIISNPGYSVEWFYRSQLEAVQTDATHLSTFSIRTGISTLNVSSNQPGYYSCVINTYIVYSFYVADKNTLIQINKFEIPSRQVDYTVGSTISLLYYSHANIADNTLRWTTDTVTNGTDILYSIEYPNPVMLSSVFSDVGAGVHTFSCFYRMSLVTAVGSIQLAIRDTTTMSINYAGYNNTFSDVNNLKFPSPQQLSIPEGTQNVLITCNLTKCMWVIKQKNETFILSRSPNNISIFGEENEGNYSLLRYTNKGISYTTAQVYIRVAINSTQQLLKNIMLIISIIIVALIIVISSIAIITIIIRIFNKNKKFLPPIPLPDANQFTPLDANENPQNYFPMRANFLHCNKRDKPPSYLNLMACELFPNTTIQEPMLEQTKSLNSIDIPLDEANLEYMAIEETSLVSLEPQLKKRPYYHNIGMDPIDEDNYDQIKEKKEYANMSKSESYENCTPMNIPKKEKKFIAKYIPAKDFPATYQQYVTSGKGNDSLFAVEFRALHEESKKNVEPEFDEARRKQNWCKNSVNTVFPFDENRVVLDSPYFDCDYINASWLENSQFIASIHPTGDTLQDFLQMIYQTEASMVIMLSTRKEKAQIISGISTRVCYWPKKDEPLRCGHFETNLNSSVETNAFVKQEISVRNTLNGKSHSYINCISPIWNEDGTVFELNFVVSLLNRVIKQKQDYPLNPIIIHCEDGISKTGILLTVFNVIKELNIRKSISIFNAVKNLFRQRMRMVPTLACYTTCYSLMNEYCSIQL